MPIHPKQLPPLSPEALAALRLPVRADSGRVFDASDIRLFSIVTASWENDVQYAAFIAAALNELLTPAAAPERSLCDWPDCDRHARPDDQFCWKHRAEEDARPVTDPAEQYADMIDPANQEEYRQADTAAMEAE